MPAIKNDNIHKLVVATYDMNHGVGHISALNACIDAWSWDMYRRCTPLKGPLITSAVDMSSLVTSEGIASQLGPRPNVLLVTRVSILLRTVIL